VEYADVISFTTHKVLRGPRGGMILSKSEHAKAIDKAVFPMMQGGPLMHAVAAKAVSLKEAATAEFQNYAKQVVLNAQALSAGLEKEGLRPVSGGTDTHLVLLDLAKTQVNGKDAEARCDAAKITLNKNPIPNDPLPPMTASGIRVGTAAVTTQGMKEPQMKEIAELIAAAVKEPQSTQSIAKQVSQLVEKFPAYPRP
jgi:glycine hydroxymethyltransferase